VLISLTDFEGNTRPVIAFEIGQLVCHRRYGYRGVIVACDPCCQAGEKWYLSNKTQPPREQPWYHVLVHKSGGISTYVAQSNLESDASGEPIDHPRLKTYFSTFQDGRYILRKSSGQGSCGI
jgi:heat shock protein HspQ